MRIRPMREEDAAAAAGLSGQLGYPSTADQIARRFRSASGRPESEIFVADEGNGRLAGWIHVVGRYLLESEPYAEIAGLVVDEARRGRGAGRLLVEAAERWARDRGYAQMGVRSNVIRSEARPFYERLGYTVFKTQYAFRKPLAGGAGGDRPA